MLALNAHGHAETSPSVRPIGPVRVRTLKEKNSLNLVPTSLGNGDQFTEELYRDLKLPEASKPVESPSYGVAPAPPAAQRVATPNGVNGNGKGNFCSFRKVEAPQFESSSNAW